MPHDLPPWAAVYQQTGAGWVVGSSRPSSPICWSSSGSGRPCRPATAMILTNRTLRSAPNRGHPGYDGYKCTKGSKFHLAVETLGEVLAILVTSANEQPWW